MMASMIFLIATSCMMSFAKRVDFHPSLVPQTGLAKLIPAVWKNEGTARAFVAMESSKAHLAQLSDEAWETAAAVLVDMTRKEEDKASKSPWLANMDAAEWDAVAKTVAEVASGMSPAAGDMDAEADVPMWNKAATALNNIAHEAKAKAAWHAKIAKVIAPVLAAGVLATSAEPAFAGDAAAGEQIFSGNCAACHAGGQNVIMPEKTLEQAALEEYLDGGANEAAVKKQVTNGKNAMPAFGNKLSATDIENVATYVISTAKEGWD